MSELVTGGFIGGHLATHGFYSAAPVPQNFDAFFDQLNSENNCSPLIRVRFDLDGDGVYEVTEFDSVISVGNVDRVVEFFTGRPRFGSGSLELDNTDQRFSDFVSGSLTYNKNYHMRPCLIELGFDGQYKHLDNYWFPLFKGFITAKKEYGESRSVDISLMDEWTQITNRRLAYTDINGISFGTYYGVFNFLPAESKNENGQILIPVYKRDGSIVSLNAINQEAISKYLPMANSTEQEKSNSELYIWAYNPSLFQEYGTVYELSESKWLKVEIGYYEWLMRYGVSNGDIIYFTDNGLIATDMVTGKKYSLIINSYYNTSIDGYNPKLAISLKSSMISNPSEILFDLLNKQCGIDVGQIDASSGTPSAWSRQFYDYDNSLFYSFDAAKYSLSGCKVTVKAEGSETVGQLIEKLCDISRGAFFISKGLKNTSTGKTERRIKFTVHEPRNESTTKTLSASRVSNPEISTDTLEVRNSVIVNNFEFTAIAKKGNTFPRITEDGASIAQYGEQEYNIGGKSNEFCFIAESDLYCKGLSEKNIQIYKRPIQRLNFNTDVIGYNWDLKSLLSVQEPISLNLSPENLSGFFEIFGFKFDTRNFRIDFNAQWAGYYISPEASDIKRWAFVDSAYTDEHPTENLTYYCW